MLVLQTIQYAVNTKLLEKTIDDRLTYRFSLLFCKNNAQFSLAAHETVPVGDSCKSQTLIVTPAKAGGIPMLLKGLADERNFFSKVRMMKCRSKTVFSGAKNHEHQKQENRKTTSNRETFPIFARMLGKLLTIQRTLLLVIGITGLASCKVKDTLACDSNADCAQISYCYSNVCILKECTDDSQCPGRHCVNSTCVENGDQGDSEDVPAQCAKNNGGCGEQVCDDSSGKVICKQMGTLVVNKTGNGSGTVTSQPEGISCGKACSKDFAINEQITLTVQPDPNSDFVGWDGGGCTGKELSCVFSLDQAKTVSANFALKTTSFSLTVTKTGNGTITSTPQGINCGTTCSTTYASDVNVSLTAQPAANYVFSGWGGSCSGTDKCNLAMNTPQTVSAGFTCVPESNAEICGNACGSMTDRCGKPRTCGCPLPQVCGGGSVANKCACANEVHPEALLTNWLPIPVSPPTSAYQELGNGIVLDTQTCLRWKKDYQKEGEKVEFSWEEAKSICSNLGDGWRLPTINELSSLIDYQKDAPTINPVFNTPDYSLFWSSTEYAGGSGSAWDVRFGNGNSYWDNQTDNGYVRCVR